MSKLKPMLAVKADMDKIKYPVLATPKLDGIRCLMVDGEAVSRNLKPIPNDHVRDTLRGLNFLDGELMLKGDFNAVQSGIMAKKGTPDFQYCVFDSFERPDDDYEHRLDDAAWDINHPKVKLIIPEIIYSEESLSAYLDLQLELGYEGVMIRQPDSPYKYGRSTVAEGWLLKLKKFEDDEGEVVEITEAMHNDNVATKDALGNTTRSTHKANKRPAGTAGAVKIKWNGHIFSVGFGPGIDNAHKQLIWDLREVLKGQLIKFSYQDLSAKGIPRFGKMLSVRHPNDL